MAHRRITSNEIIHYLLNRERTGCALSSSAIRRDNSPIYHAAYKRFGSWPKTLAAAGLDPRRHCRSRDWSPQRVIDRILHLNSRGISLRRCEMNQYDPGLLAAAHIQFGSWQSALELAGIHFAEYCSQAKWAREQVIEAILLRAVKREPLGSTTVRPTSLRTSAVAAFGSWRDALSAAGLDPREHVGVRTKKPALANYSSQERVRKALLQRTALGLPCQPQAVRRQNPRLFRAVHRHFKSFRRAFECAGLDIVDPEAGPAIIGCYLSTDDSAVTTR